jgi:hypothetical protein
VLRRALPFVLAVVIAGPVLVLNAGPASADDPWTNLTCQGASCEAQAGSSGSQAKTAKATKARGKRVCRDFAGKSIACYDSFFGTWNDKSNCYRKPTTVSSAAAAAFGGAGKGPGGWYEETCFGYQGTGGGAVWIADGAVPNLVTPAELAQRSADSFALKSPTIEANPLPGQEQLVSLPTWLWIPSSAWKPATATASVPGISVTATATPTSVTWTTGDGGTVVCDGPGTKFPTNGDPRSASPDCGHVYTQSSANQPSKAFTVTATISWAITWAGGGQQGTLPALQTASTARFRVAESQTLITGATS